MIKKYLRAWLPSPQKIASLRIMKLFGSLVNNPIIWYINRRSICKAIFIGTFLGLLPIPFHSVLIILAVFLFEANLPLALALAWITNPLTLVPVLYVGFWFGSWIYQVPMIDKPMMLGILHQCIHWIKSFGKTHLDLNLAKVLATGLLIEATVFSILLYLLSRLIWRLDVSLAWRKRKTTSVLP